MPPVPDRLVRLGLVLAVTGLLVIAIVSLFVGHGYFTDPERYAINSTRAAHIVRFSGGTLLPGTPDLASLDNRLAANGVALGAPVLIRIFKREFELELWMARDGRFHRFATYPVCVWSGWLGPKIATGDKQAPEGFYTVASNQMNPNSRWHRSFNLGFPNAFDAAHGRTGSALMVHGGCSSAGCYAMTNAVIDEIWRLTSAALAGKQKAFQVQIYPFRMSEENLTAQAKSPHAEYWRQLKLGSDLFEATWLPPVVNVCQGAYRFKPGSLPETALPVVTDCAVPHTIEKVDAKKAL